MQSAKTRRVTVGARSVLAALLLTALALALFVLVGRLRRPAEGPTQFTFRMGEYDFAPDNVRWRAGETVTLTVVNDSAAVPGKPHEIMFGNDPWVEPGPFGPRQRDGFLTDFLAGPLRVDAAQGVSMLMVGGLSLTGDADALLAPAMGGMSGASGDAMGDGMSASAMSGAGASGDTLSGESMSGAGTTGDAMTGDAMTGDAMTGDGATTVDMAGADVAGAPGADAASAGGMASAEMDAGGLDPGSMGVDASAAPGPGMDSAGADAGGMDMGGMDMGGMQMYLSEDMVGKVEPETEEMKGNFMLVLQPGGSFTMTFTVPDKPGSWTFGCFQQSGEHFLNGMRGTITVLPAAGAGS